ncbi:3D domain-containing protein [Thermohalobacter berrensis]|nr:3D domain-containing protein [Thermohalobacter berrensis]
MLNGNKNKIFILLSIVVILAISLGMYKYTIKNITISIDEEKISLKTSKKTVEELLESENIKLTSYDYINVDLEQKLKDDMKIIIKRAVPVTILVDNKQIRKNTYLKTVEEVLNDTNIKVDNNDRISPRLDEEIKSNMEIKVTRVEEKIETKEEEISYRQVVKSNDKLEKGKTRLIKKGQEGLKKVKIKKIYEDGELVSQVILEENIVKEPVNEVIEKGTKDYLVSSRGNIRFKGSIIMTATAYDLSYESTGKRPGDKGYGITASGTRARRGVVAVDPNVIPLGTKLYIKSLDGSEDYGFAVAEDTGGAIKGNRIDVFIPDREEALRFGIRKVKVYILE